MTEEMFAAIVHMSKLEARLEWLQKLIDKGKEDVRKIRPRGE
jgi:hypothetical protein